MNVTPKHYLNDDAIRTIPSEDKGTLVIECEVRNPPSAKGKTVYVIFEPADVTKALLLMRDAARRARM